MTQLRVAKPAIAQPPLWYQLNLDLDVLSHTLHEYMPATSCHFRQATEQCTLLAQWHSLHSTMQQGSAPQT